MKPSALRWILSCGLLGLTARAAPAPLTAEGFALPEVGHVFSFPRDHGAHRAFRIEWWYLTGHLLRPDRHRYGFQATFFRLAGPPGTPSSSPQFGEDQLYLAHMALTDVGTQRFLFEERLNREGWDAGAKEEALDLHNGNWSLRFTAGAEPRLDLAGSVRADAAFALTFRPAKPLVVFGEDSVSHKGAEPAAASYYLTFSRLRATGRLTVGGVTGTVEGEAWMDHEISSSQLGQGQVGWDWVSLQFRGRPWEVMLYRLRLADGSADPASRLQWVNPEGRAVTAPYQWAVLRWWTSPRTGARYPARVRLMSRDPASGASVQWTLEPLVADQELAGALGGGAYWEGACRVLDGAGTDVGSAYMELTGYAGPLKL